jgi:hypothetical protein
VLVSRLLSPNPDDRPQRGNEVVSELTEIARQNGFESTTSQLSELVVQVFPEEAGGATEPPPIAIMEDIVVRPTDSMLSARTGSQSQNPATRPTNQGLGVSAPRTSTRDLNMNLGHSTQPRPVPPTPELPNVSNRWLLIAIVVVLATAIGLFVVYGPL